ncbi:hypothetical protein ACFFX0_32730 [Citricoccus parietis]|uniref:Uncharacterized protein n=1 Tax=Citricoccus parietis TaxID=592307 RepID=A0ABV5G9R5_9MICC
MRSTSAACIHAPRASGWAPARCAATVTRSAMDSEPAVRQNSGLYISRFTIAATLASARVCWSACAVLSAACICSRRAWASRSCILEPIATRSMLPNCAAISDSSSFSAMSLSYRSIPVSGRGRVNCWPPIRARVWLGARVYWAVITSTVRISAAVRLANCGRCVAKD